MRSLIFVVLLVAALSASANEQRPGATLNFNGVRLGDAVGRIKESKRSGQCDGRGKTLTECTIFDGAGIAYEINDGHVVRIEAKKGITSNAALPFGVRIGMGMGDVMKRSFPQDGGQAFIKSEKAGLTVIRMIREPKTDYEFELQLHFDNSGKLENVVYKDVI